MGHPASTINRAVREVPGLLGVLYAPLPRRESAAGHWHFVGAIAAKFEQLEHNPTRLQKSYRGPSLPTPCS
jgi:hypothetical protein